LNFLKTLTLWILALQLLNMSICSEAYWFYYNDGRQVGANNFSEADPTETIVELLVEMKLGQQEAFNYDQHEIDPKNAIKAMVCQIDLENELSPMPYLRKNSRIYFPDLNPKIESAHFEIISPPPDRDLQTIYVNI